MRSRWIVLGMVSLVACGPSSRDDGGGDSDRDDAPDGTDVDAAPGPDGDSPLSTFVYAHTSSQLYRVDPDTLAVDLVGSFTFSGVREEITDIAIDRTGQMIGISFASVFRIDPATAGATKFPGSSLAGSFNGLSFVPAAQLGRVGDDVLVGTRLTDGVVSEINPITGAAVEIGDMGAFSSSGDLVSIANLGPNGGTLQTADNGTGNDRLVTLANGNFAATQIGTDIGFAEIWGLAYWKDKLFGFTENGEFITIDPDTGVGTLVQGGGPAWWGAAVTTLAPVVQ